MAENREPEPVGLLAVGKDHRSVTAIGPGESQQVVAGRSGGIHKENEVVSGGAGPAAMNPSRRGDQARRLP